MRNFTEMQIFDRWVDFCRLDFQNREDTGPEPEDKKGVNR
jgi:hypothetical protein